MALRDLQVGDNPEIPGFSEESNPQADRLDALLEERFRSADRKGMARQIADHDLRHTPDPTKPTDTTFDKDHVRRKLLFHGSFAEKVQQAIEEWLVGMLAYAAGQGLRLRDLNHEVHFYDPPSYAQMVKELPQGLSLPAVSHGFNQLYRIYTVRVVMPRELADTAQLLGVLRAVLGRLLGEIYLREEVFNLAAYREDVEDDKAPAVGLAEKIQILAGTTHRTKKLDTMLEAYGQEINLNYKRQPEAVRKAFFQLAQTELEAQRLSELRTEVMEAAFEDHLKTLEADLPSAIAQAVEEVEEKNRQLNFLPPDELPYYAQLRTKNPLHYLRSARLRLGFLVEHLATVAEAFTDLDTGQVPSPLMEEQLDGVLMELRTQNLVRAYLIPGARLSDDLEQQKATFPFQVHALVERMPGEEDPAKAFKRLSKRINNSLYQRLYHAIMLLQTWIRAHIKGQGAGFISTEGFQTLKGQAANFRFRKPMLEALYLKLGVLLELAEVQNKATPTTSAKRFPTSAFTKSWGQFIPHAVLADYIGFKGGLRGFDQGAYWQSIEQGMQTQTQKDSPTHRLALMLRELHKQGGGLNVFPELLENPPGTLRFVVHQALHPPPKYQQLSPEEQLAQVPNWAATILRTLEARRKNTIRPGDAP